MLLAPLARMMVHSLGEDSGRSRPRHREPRRKRRRSRSRSRSRSRRSRRQRSRSRSPSRRSRRSQSGRSQSSRQESPPPPPPPRRKKITNPDQPPVLEKEVPVIAHDHGEKEILDNNNNNNTNNNITDNHSIIVPSIHSSACSNEHVPTVNATTPRGTESHQGFDSRDSESMRYVNVAPNKYPTCDSNQLEKVIPPNKDQVLFVENRKVIKHTAAERIALAYKYDPSIIPKPKQKKEKNTAFRGSDEEDKEKEVKISNPTSFPPSQAVQDEWFAYSKRHHKNTKPTVVYDIEKQEKPSESGETQPGGSTESEEKGVVKPAAGLYRKVVKNEALKNPPEKLAWTFDHHVAGWADMVVKDKDIDLILKDKDKDPQMELRLCKKEWQHLQLAQNYILNAASHIQYYLSSSREAINQVLDTLDPAIESANLEKLQDTKAMLKGVGYGVETITSMGVYSHSGITALQREQFLMVEADYIPPEVKSTLIGQPFGSHYLYNDKLSKVMPLIEKARKEHKERLLQQALINSMKAKETKHTQGNENDFYEYDETYNAGRGRGRGRPRGRPRGNRGNRGGRGFQGQGRGPRKEKKKFTPRNQHRNRGGGHFGNQDNTAATVPKANEQTK